MCPIFNNFLPLKNISNSKLVLVLQNCPNYFIHSKKCLFFIKIVRLTTKFLSHVCKNMNKSGIRGKPNGAQFVKEHRWNADICILIVFSERKSICTSNFWDLLVNPERFCKILNHMQQILDALRFEWIQYWKLVKCEKSASIP